MRNFPRDQLDPVSAVLLAIIGLLILIVVVAQVVMALTR